MKQKFYLLLLFNLSIVLNVYSQTNLNTISETIKSSQSGNDTTVTLIYNNDGYYSIYSVNDLRVLSSYADSNNCSGLTFKLMNDIDFDTANLVYDFDGLSGNESNFIPIGNNFAGIFDGNNKTISGLKIKYKIISSNNDVGLFGYIEGAMIKNLNITKAELSGNSNVGGICGYLTTISNGNIAKIENCSCTYSTIEGNNNLGGICGQSFGYTNSSGTRNLTIINKCFSDSVNITGKERLGSICGYNISSEINNSYCISDLITATNQAGGICGCNGSIYCKISNCYSTTKIKKNNTSNDNLKFGGLIGTNYNNDTIIKSYCIDTWKQETISGTLSGSQGTGTKTYTEMQSAGFISELNDSNSTFNIDYFSVNNNYPIFSDRETKIINSLIDSGTITENIVIPSNYNGIPFNNIRIKDGASLMDNRINILNNAIIEKKMRVNNWNLFGVISSANASSVLNNNIGDNQTTNSHDMAAVGFEYTDSMTANNWNTNNYLDDTSTFNCGESYFVYPFKSHYRQTTELLDKYLTIIQNDTVKYDSVIFNKTNNGEVSGNGKWFALSNPFIGRINVSKLCSAYSTQIQGINKVYTYNEKTNSWENPSFIYPSQGFMIASKNDSPSINIILKKEYLEGYPSFKKEEVIENPISNIEFIVSANGISKKTFARIDKTANNGFDGKDAFILFSDNNENFVEPYFLVDNHFIMENVFCSLPYIVPINFHSNKVSEANLIVKNIPNNILISIIDIKTGKETLLNDTCFHFIVNKGENENNFLIKFNNNAVSLANNIKKNTINIWENNKNIIVSGDNILNFELINLLGQNVYKENVFQSIYCHNFSSFSGTYIIKVTDNNGVKTQKVLL